MALEGHLVLAYGAGLVSAAVILYLWSRVGFWREMYHQSAAVYDEVLDRALGAEKTAQQSQTEHMFLKQTVVQLLQRPVAVVLTDEQFSHLVTTLSQIVAGAAKAPDRMN